MASNNQIPNLQTLLGARRGGGLRGRARGAGRLAGPGAGSEHVSDNAVRATDQDAAASRVSCVELGYLHDPYAKLFATQPATRRLPLLNRGSYVRTSAIDRLVTKFILTQPASAKQIVSLGAGTDTRFFRLTDAYPNLHLRYHEIDFPSNTMAKIASIQQQPLLHRKLRKAPRDATSYHSETYNIHALDLRSLASFPDAPSRPDIPNLDPTIPTLILSEMCLAYLQPSTVQSIISTFLGHYLQPTTPASLVLYEPILPQDAFGKIMISNLKMRNIHLHTLVAYPELADQRARLKGYGLDTASEAEDTSHIWRHWISDEEKERVAGLEFLDELEELELLLRHYCVAWGWRDGTSDIFSKAWVDIGKQSVV
ncbi:carboxy methyl transferase for protein phosphatase 2A [Pleosporales sp. CAS-2024a]